MTPCFAPEPRVLPRHRRLPGSVEGGMEEQLVECDVLCAGGGIAGMMAAIRAAELGANVGWQSY